jgi:hypothetical protein
MSSKDRYDRQLDGLLNEIDRSAVEASDAEILEDAKLAGIDIEANAKDLRQRFLDSARAYYKRKFVQAKHDYAHEVKDLQDRKFQIPASAARQRALLQQAQKAMTVSAFRDFEGMPDSDLPALIEELYALGLLPPQDEEE